jgi:uncharacterized membrane protein
MLRRVLLLCGILSSVLYVAMNVYMAVQWKGYSSASQTVSELSAIGAPTHYAHRFAMVTVLLMMLAIGFGAAAFERRFSLYSIGALVILVAFRALTSVEAPRIQANLPTPWVGVWGEEFSAVHAD